MSKALWVCPNGAHITAVTDTFPPRIPYCHNHDTELVWLRDVE